MTAEAVTITGSAWTAISSAGESGTCWLQKKPSDGGVVVNHIESADPSTLDMDESYFLPDNKRKIVDIVADSATDIFYARCIRSDGSAIIVVDVV